MRLRTGQRKLHSFYVHMQTNTSLLNSPTSRSLRFVSWYVSTVISAKIGTHYYIILFTARWHVVVINKKLPRLYFITDLGSSCRFAPSQNPTLFADPRKRLNQPHSSCCCMCAIRATRVPGRCATQLCADHNSCINKNITHVTADIPSSGTG